MIRNPVKLTRSDLCLVNSDCFNFMKLLPNNYVDFVLVDPPYGITQCDWDVPFDIDLMWGELGRVVKSRGCIAIFGVEPFLSRIRVKNIKNYKYDWIWVKDKPVNFLNARKMPLRSTERISIFYKKQCKYYPQLSKKKKEYIRPAPKNRIQVDGLYGRMSNDRGCRTIPIDMSYPDELLYYKSCFGYKGKSNHPTEKPVLLLEYFIKTYSDPFDIVLDFTMGSGSTGVACARLNRKFIGVEKDFNFFKKAEQRILSELK